MAERLTGEMREALTTLSATLGQVAAARALGIARPTLRAAIAGGALRVKVRARIADALENLKAPIFEGGPQSRPAYSPGPIAFRQGAIGEIDDSQ